MTEAEIRFYLDENLPVEIARQLRARDIEVVTVRDLGLLGGDDKDHLRRATEMGLVGLARILGHESLDTTKIYTQPTIEQLARRMRRLALNAYG